MSGMNMLECVLGISYFRARNSLLNDYRIGDS